MSGKNEISTADAFDRGRRRIALMTMAISIIFAGRAADHVLGPEADGYLQIVKIAMQIVAVAAFLSVVYWVFVKLPKGERHLYFSADGFVIDTVRRAQNISWIVTFLALMVLEEISGMAPLRELPSSFFLQAAMAVMLGVSSVVFFYLNRSEEENEAEQDSHA